MNTATASANQVSNSINRAKKEYRNKPFELLLREIILNALHASVQEDHGKDTKKIAFSISSTRDGEGKPTSVSITVEDSGCGINDDNFFYFKQLDEINQSKIKRGLPAKGQGRLALLHFADRSHYISRYEQSGKHYKREFNYPIFEDTLFENSDTEEIMESEFHKGTLLEIKITSRKKLSKADTFLQKYNFENWLELSFLPFFVNHNCTLDFEIEGRAGTVSSDIINKKIRRFTFLAKIDNQNENFTGYVFDCELAKEVNSVPVKLYGESIVIERKFCSVDISLDRNVIILIGGEFLEQRVNSVGDDIELGSDEKKVIQQAINDEISELFNEDINRTRKKNDDEFKSFRKDYPSLSDFLPEEDPGIILKTKEKLIQETISEKGKREIDFWQSPEESEADKKLLKSSLFLYVTHRKRIISHFDTLLNRLDSKTGDTKKQNEDEIHELILSRGFNDERKDENYLDHNLWLIDDKLSYFTSARSSRTGEKGSDIYLYYDDDKNPAEIILIELKSSIESYNKDVISQVKIQAQDFYEKKKNINGRDIDTKSCRYFAFIIASTSDINAIRKTTTNSCRKIPFLKNSYVTEFDIFDDANDGTNCSVELYTYNDLQELSEKRNNVFLKILENSRYD